MPRSRDPYPTLPLLQIVVSCRGLLYLPPTSMSELTLYQELTPRDQALIDESGGGNRTVVSARMVQALNGNGNAAIYLSQLLWWGRRKADDDGWFFRTRDDMHERCGLGKEAQRTAEKVLKSLGLIETERRGMPAKKHFRLHYSSIISTLVGDSLDPGGTPKDKSSGVGTRTSHGGYPTEQVVGGTPEDNTSYKSTQENNRENSSARPEEKNRRRGYQLLQRIVEIKLPRGDLEEKYGEHWAAVLYEKTHPDYTVQPLTRDEWRQVITDPVAWCKALIRGIKRGWQPHTIDAREDVYEEIVEHRQEEDGSYTPLTDKQREVRV